MKVTKVSEIYIGTDIIEVQRISYLICKYNQRFTNRIFTKLEREYCQSKKTPEVHYSGRFAAKEAVYKAINSPSKELFQNFKSIEVLQDTDGKPVVTLHSYLKYKIDVSISHTNSHAVAMAICYKI